MTAGGSTINGAQNRPLMVAIANEWRDFVSGNAEGVPDPTPGGAELTSVSPTSIVHGGGPPVTLTGTGTGFVSGVYELTWNGAVLSTTFVSATSLTAQVTSNLFATAGTATVRVEGAEGVKTVTIT